MGRMFTGVNMTTINLVSSTAELQMTFDRKNDSARAFHVILRNRHGRLLGLCKALLTYSVNLLLVQPLITISFGRTDSLVYFIALFICFLIRYCRVKWSIERLVRRWSKAFSVLSMFVCKSTRAKLVADTHLQTLFWWLRKLKSMDIWNRRVTQTY